MDEDSVATTTVVTETADHAVAEQRALNSVAVALRLVGPPDARVARSAE